MMQGPTYTWKQVLVLGLASIVACHPNHLREVRRNVALSPRADGNSTSQIFYGRFISTPNPRTLSIQNGAVLVTSSDGRGYIKAIAFNVTSPEDAAAALGASSDIAVVQAADSGFFFPGFVGMLVS
jgi:hypothetical protein